MLQLMVKYFFPRTWILNPCAHYSCRVNCFDYFFMHYYLSTKVRKPLSSIIMKTCFYMCFLFFFALALSCPLYHQTLTLFTTGLCNNTKVHGDDRLKLPRQMRSGITRIIQNSQKNNPSWKWMQKLFQTYSSESMDWCLELLLWNYTGNYH